MVVIIYILHKQDHVGTCASHVKFNYFVHVQLLINMNMFGEILNNQPCIIIIAFQ